MSNSVSSTLAMPFMSFEATDRAIEFFPIVTAVSRSFQLAFVCHLPTKKSKSCTRKDLGQGRGGTSVEALLEFQRQSLLLLLIKALWKCLMQKLL